MNRRKQSDSRSKHRDQAGTLFLRSRQRSRQIDLRLFRRMVLACLNDLLDLKSFEVGVRFVNAREMTHLNEQYLGHQGSTDVITFDYLEGGAKDPRRIFGDIYVCVDEAVVQARRFRTSWQQELLRYVVHGILHLLGYDDGTMRLRRPMKQVENKLVRALTAQFALRSSHG